MAFHVQSYESVGTGKGKQWVNVFNTECETLEEAIAWLGIIVETDFAMKYKESFPYRIVEV